MKNKKRDSKVQEVPRIRGTFTLPQSKGKKKKKKTKISLEYSESLKKKKKNQQADDHYRFNTLS